MENLRGIAFMIAAMAAFAVEDVLIKMLASSLPISQILIIVGTMTGSFCCVVAVITKTRLLMPELTDTAVIVRFLTDTFATLFFVYALALIPLSSISAIIQAAPLLITLGAIVFFKEKVGIRHWMAIVFGFVGVILILRPGSEAFTPASLLAVVATVFMAARDLSTRLITAQIPTLTISTYSFLGAAIAGVIALPFDGPFSYPNSSKWIHLTTICLVAGLSNFMLILATRHGDASVIAPFRYTRIVFAMILAVFVMHESPPWQTLLGAAIILSSGCYILSRKGLFLQV